MRALTLTRRPAPGTLADVIQMVDVADPEPRSREVVVRVFASSINIDDIHVAEGTFYGGIPIGPRPRPGRPVTPGSDLAGTVIRVGAGVHSIRPGDAVFGVQTPFRARGAWAEACAVDERWLTVKPEKLTFCKAAACGLSGLVAVSAMDALKLRPGSRIVIVGATGGIGGMAVQLASRSGAEVIGVCSPASFERARRLGCSQVFDYHDEAWEVAISASGEVSIEGVLDTVGGRDIEQAGRRLLGRDGTFATIVGPERFIGDRALGWPGVMGVLARVGYRVISSRIRGPRYLLAGPGPGAGRRLIEVARTAAAGVLPPIDSTVPFELGAMRQAIRRAVAHQNHGRIVIQMEKAA
jgi:alcohol dehydrogenase